MWSEQFSYIDAVLYLQIFVFFHLLFILCSLRCFTLYIWFNKVKHHEVKSS